MRKIALLWTICLSTLLANAQIENFDLSTYKLPDIKRHQLDLNAGLDGGNSYYEYYRRLGNDYTEKLNGINGDFGVGYRFYKNSESYQGNQYVGIGLNADFKDEKDENGFVGEQFYFRNNFQISSVNRFYIRNKFFLESDLYFGQSYSKRNSSDELDKTEDVFKNIHLNVQLGIGYGRVEEVQDAWLATYILKGLQKNGKLIRTPTEEEILEFSTLISQLKNERFFDARLQKIKEIEEVDKFLQSRNLIDQADARYFTIVNDNWDHAATQIRRAGNRLSFLINPSILSSDGFYEIDDYSTITTRENIRTEYKVQAQLTYVNEKPVNLYWQQSFSVLLSGNYMQGLYNYSIDGFNEKSEVKSPQINSRINYSLRYYPNTRTILIIGANINFINYYGTEEYENTKNDINYLDIIPKINFGLNYYISPQLLFVANYAAYYNYSESNLSYYDNDFFVGNRFNQSINIGFKYQIF